MFIYMEWLSDTAANQFKNSYFNDINETGVTIDISGNLQVRHGIARARGLPPIGGIAFWSGSIEVDGTVTDYSNWQICDGTNSTPDLRGRFVIGTTGIDADTSITVGTESATYNLEQTGGEISVVLAEGNLPSHNHGVVSGGSHNHGYTVYEQNDFNWNATNFAMGGHRDTAAWNGEQQSTTVLSSDAAGHNHGGALTNTGSGQAHDNMPPYYVLTYIMRMS